MKQIIDSIGNNEILIKICYGFGIIVILMIIGMGIVFCFCAIKNGVQYLSNKYKYQHRFNKPPLATCYCLYCENHGKTGKCMLPGVERYTPDDGFCYMSYPKKENKNA